MIANNAYLRAKLAASTTEVALLCEQMQALCCAVKRGACPNPLAIHKLLMTEAPTPQSHEMHGALALILAQVTVEAPPLGFEHVQLWAAISRHFIVSGVRQVGAQFAIETEALLAKLSTDWAETKQRLVKDLDEEIKARDVARSESDQLGALLETQSKAHANQVAVMLECQKLLDECVTYARTKRGKDFDYDTWETLCQHAMRGQRAPSALENEIALHAETRAALERVRKERDELLVEDCQRLPRCGKCLSCRRPVSLTHGAPIPASKLEEFKQATRTAKKRTCVVCNGLGSIASDEPFMQMASFTCSTCNGRGSV